MPFLGLPIYVFAFPRAKRFWHTVNNSENKRSGESLLYRKFFQNFAGEIHKLANKYYFLLRPGKFYLIRIEKYLATLQVLESGNSYLIV
jgi:hypothetical protein